MQAKSPFIVLCIIAATALLLSVKEASCANPNLLSNALGSNMVLQRAPQSAKIWGWTLHPHAKVAVKFNGHVLQTTSDDASEWKVLLPPTQAGGPYTISVASSEGDVAQLENVLFGDVWLCGGQSNMEFSVYFAFNSTQEIALADHYPEIRLFTVGQNTTSNVSLNRFASIEQHWSVANSKSVGHSGWTYFSATCWFFGKQLYDHHKVPLGLVSTNWGGTIIQAWSSADALSQCSDNKKSLSRSFVSGEPRPKDVPSALWNAMVVPLLPMRIRGAVWYQAENNIPHADYYRCAFKAMISDWRAKFNLTPDQFGFHFVQLAAYTGPKTALADMRIAQSAALSLPNVGMATAMDLGDLDSPEGNIHPRNKEAVGLRLSLAARGITYGEKIQYTGPTFSGITVLTQGPSASVQINFEAGSIGSGLVLVEATCPKHDPQPLCACAEIKGSDGKWYEAKHSLDNGKFIFTATIPKEVTVTGARYGYQEWPLAVLYNKEGLPATPFRLSHLRFLFNIE